MADQIVSSILRACLNIQQKIMNLNDLHDPNKKLSALPFFHGAIGKSTAIQLLANEKLKEHITQTPARLICITGEVIYEDEQGVKSQLSSADFIDISPMLKHWLIAIADSQLLLLK